MTTRLTPSDHSLSSNASSTYNAISDPTLDSMLMHRNSNRRLVEAARKTERATRHEMAEGITVRRLDFKPKQIPRYYVAKSPILSHIFTTLSSTFPIGEGFFVHSIRQVRERIKDETLQAQISAFIGQESMHSLSHAQFNAAWRADSFQLDKLVSWLAEQVDHSKKLPNRYQVAVTCAYEHFTAMICEYALDHPELLDAMDDEAKRLWLWHAVEESEHKSVAFDVFQTLFHDEKVRKKVMRAITVAFFSIIFTGTASLMWQDKAHSFKDIKGNVRGLYLFSKIVFTLVPEYMAYFKDDFHPSQRDRTALLNKWRAYLQETMPNTRSV